MARDSDKMQATGPLFDAINVAVADAIFGAIEKGADPLAAISAAVISAADFGRLAFGDEILDQLADTLAMQKDKPLPKIER